MKMGFNLQLEQSQKLIMTPQLQQAIQILQFNSLELEEFIAEQLEKNPVLENDAEKEHNELWDSKIEDKIKEINWKEYIEDFNNYSYTKSNYQNEDNEFNYENIISNKSSLQEYLLFQYSLTLLDRKYFEIGEYLINSIDDRGYLTVTIKDVTEHFNEEENIVESILQIIQSFDPPGVGARTIEECLLLQLRFLDVKDEKIYQLIKEYLPEIAANKYPLLAKKLGVTIEQLQGYCDFIKTLEPKPGRMFESNLNRYITPDITVKKLDEEYILLTNDFDEPRLKIREDYRTMIISEDENSEVAKFLNNQFNSAAWHIRSIEQRKQTIYKVAEVIVEKQKGFFEKGKKFLVPMTLKEVAEEISVHESTVSRATNGKYMETPHGTFELKFFFTGGVESDEGMGISSESIKSFIRDIIKVEDPKKPLSDDKIVSELERKGISISRRTVAKYRDEMGILSSSKRKRY